LTIFDDYNRLQKETERDTPLRIVIWLFVLVPLGYWFLYPKEGWILLISLFGMILFRTNEKKKDKKIEGVVSCSSCHKSLVRTIEICKSIQNGSEQNDILFSYCPYCGGKI
jgi:hypothetical protein